MSRPANSSSDKSFGITFAVVFAVIGLWPWIVHGRSPYLWALALALLFLATGLCLPRALKPLNRLWFRFGLALHTIVNPIVMLLLYWGAVAPMGLIVKAFGKDLLRLKRNPTATSYWTPRDPPGPTPESMKKQF
jgi:predicted membrane metal-binding protein